LGVQLPHPAAGVMTIAADCVLGETNLAPRRERPGTALGT
jgi:hypothetical protein